MPWGERKARVELRRVRDALGELERLTRLSSEVWGARAPAVSAWSPGEQVHHALLALEVAATKVDEALSSAVAPAAACQETELPTAPSPHRSGPAPRRSLRPIGALVLLTRWIPRGRGRAPEILLPPPNAAPEEVARLLQGVGCRWARLEPRAGEIGRSRSSAPHFIFGDMTPRQWVRFAALHTCHHLRIVSDILRASRAVTSSRA